MAAGIASKNPVLVLQTYQVHLTRVQKVCGCSIGRDVAFFNLKSDSRGVGVRRSRIVDGDDRRSTSSVLGSHRIAQICRKGCNSTLSRKVVSYNRNPEWKRQAGHQLQAG
jgi:hypothetical protein